MNAIKTTIFAIFCVFALGSPSTLHAQRGGDRGGGDRGGGDRGSGGFRGGGGPPGGVGSRVGGSRGGGDRGSRGGGSSGFDPSGFLSRLDRNGNGTIDPDEQQGPAQFLIQRMASADPSIKAGQPISIKRVTDAFNKMREQRDSSSSSRGSAPTDDSLTPELLVPGFGLESAPAMLSGFGPTAEMMDVVVSDADLKEAGDTIRRYDRNKDGVLKKDELSSRFSGNPMDFDRNKDGRLTQSELAVRYARRRESRELAKSQEKSRKRDSGRDSDVEQPDVFGGRKSYRIGGERKLPEGLPGFFADKDANQDGQVEMAEFASDWNDETVGQFFQSDLNRDGVITPAEAIKAVEEGVQTASASSSGTTMASTSGGGSASPSAGGGEIGQADSKMISYAERIIGRYDANKDKKLVASEWKKMLMSPAAADFNRDGAITTNEYAWWMQSRSKKK